MRNRGVCPLGTVMYQLVTERLAKVYIIIPLGRAGGKRLAFFREVDRRGEREADEVEASLQGGSLTFGTPFLRFESVTRLLRSIDKSQWGEIA